MDSDIEYFDESVYLNPICNLNAISLLRLEGNEIVDEVNSNKNKYEYGIKLYNEYIKCISLLLNEINTPNNAISAAMILRRLLVNGTFSLDNKFKFLDNGYKDIVGFWGSNIILGYGCCRHVSNFISDVLTESQFNNMLFYNYITDNNLENANAYKANHVINLINSNGTFYGYDGLDGYLYRFIDSTKMKSIYRKNDSYVYYKPYVNIAYNKLSVDEIKKIISIFGKNKDNLVISQEEYIYLWNFAKDAVNNNKDLIQEFERLSQNGIKKLVRELK